MQQKKWSMNVNWDDERREIMRINEPLWQTVFESSRRLDSMLPAQNPLRLEPILTQIINHKDQNVSDNRIYYYTTNKDVLEFNNAAFEAEWIGRMHFSTTNPIVITRLWPKRQTPEEHRKNEENLIFSGNIYRGISFMCR